MAGKLLRGTAYITGAASGIGKATAFGLARHGIQRLALTDISQKNLTQTTEELKSQFPEVEIHSSLLDVSNLKAVDESILETVNKFGRIDVGVNVAGVGGEGKPTDQTDPEDWGKVIEINLNGVWRCQRAQIKAMLKQEDLGMRTGRGTIINVASMYGLIAPPSYIPVTAYAASKHGVVGLTRSDAVMYAPQGIRINAICPGYVKTPLLLAAMDSGILKPEIEKTPMGRMAEVEEIADSIAFMASPMASFMAGSALLVDGGYLGN